MYTIFIQCIFIFVELKREDEDEKLWGKQPTLDELELKRKREFDKKWIKSFCEETSKQCRLVIVKNNK